jgi:periodic tryptophan protein 1
LATLASAHTSKVQALAWHPSEASILLSAAYDRTAVVSDARSPLEASMRVSIGGDAEAVLWSGESTFMVATERGHVLCYDVRNSKKALYTLDAHDGKACSTLSMHKGAPGLLVTGGIDGVVKVWDVSSKPSLMTSRNVSIGNVFVASQAFDDPFLLAIGGSQGIVSLWNLLDTKVVAHKYGREAVPSVQIQYNSKDGDESEDELGAGGDGEDDMQD